MPGLTRVCSLSGHEERVWSIAWRPGVEPVQLASCGADCKIRIWGVKPGTAVDSEDAWTLLTEVDASDQHSRTLRSLVWNPDGRIAAIASFDATVSLWRDSKVEGQGLQFECVGVVKGHENEVKCSAFSPTGEYFATCSRDKSVWIYETEQTNFEYECVALLQSHTQDVKWVRWHPSQDILFSCSYDDTIKVWGPDGDDWSCKETMQGHESTVWCLCFDATGSSFASCSDDRTVKIWVPADQNMQAAEAPASKFQGIGAAAFVSPLFRGASGFANQGGSAQHPNDNDTSPQREAPADASCQWTCVATLQGQHPRAVYACDWLQTESTTSRAVIATACGDNRVRVFEAEDHVALNTWRFTAEVEAHDGDANAVAWCPRQPSAGAGLLASAGDDCEVTLWRYDN